MRRKALCFISIFTLLLITACDAGDSAKSSKTQKSEEKNSVSIQEKKVKQKTNPATVEVVK
ncbi:hypothetical protein CHH62_22035 [Niallia circulans]|jgi:ABC-type enterochelin transport system substrate-binding protein|uniref:hypothetical protein n=1 Tax=Niallia circulans TaxID=1397 RepID=UPI000BA733A0|nr:hypothetical protein [Niallia circulans]PAD23552.1 hypothetical protein CHH62_22035 [Niallia circulans]